MIEITGATPAHPGTPRAAPGPAARVDASLASDPRTALAQEPARTDAQPWDGPRVAGQHSESVNSHTPAPPTHSVDTAAPQLPIRALLPDLPPRPRLPRREPQDRQERDRLLVEAVAALPALPASDGTRYHPRRLTVLWLAKSDSNDTRCGYFDDLYRWLAWCARRGVAPLQARLADADEFAVELTGKPATVAKRLAAVSSWYRYLRRNQAVETNPFDAAERPEVSDESPTRGITAQEARAILDHAQARADRCDTEATVRNALLLHLLIGTGLRIGGLLGAKLTDLDDREGHRVLWYRNKGGKRRRTALPHDCLRLLERYLALRAARDGVAVDALRRSDAPLLVRIPQGRRRPGGQRLVQRNAWHLLRDTAKAAGVTDWDRFSPHSGRTAHITLALQTGVPLKDVQDQAGHDDIRQTQRYDRDRHNLDRSPVYAVSRLLATTHPEAPGES